MPLPADVLHALAGDPGATVRNLTEQLLTGSSGAATGEVVRVAGTLDVAGDLRPFSVVRKSVRPVTSGRHAAAARRPDHWAYWRREPLVYGAGLAARGPGVRAPSCYGVHDDTVWLEDVTGPAESAPRAARNLGRWQAAAALPDVGWLAGHQLAQRVAVTELDWSAVDADPRGARLWGDRHALLDGLARVPSMLSHGDFSLGNLRAGLDETVAFDWGTLGGSPVGADCAHLALSAVDPGVLAPYVDGLGGTCPRRDVELGFRTTLVLTGASRVHWMHTAGVPVPDGYVDLLWDNRP